MLQGNQQASFCCYLCKRIDQKVSCLKLVVSFDGTRHHHTPAHDSMIYHISRIYPKEKAHSLYLVVAWYRKFTHKLHNLFVGTWTISWLPQCQRSNPDIYRYHDDVIKWKHFPLYWPFVWGIHRSPVNSPHKGQRHGALVFSLICVWINGWVNNRELVIRDAIAPTMTSS